MEQRGVSTVTDVLTSEQIHGVLQQAVGAGWRLAGSDIRPACVGLSGFLGDHFRVTLDVRVADRVRKVNLFVKSLPLSNPPKAKVIDELNYYRREMIMFELFEKMQAYADESNPWCAKAYVYTDKIVVMPDLIYQGYRQHPQLDCLDLEHTLLTAASLARFHAAFANYETTRALGGHSPFSKEHANILNEPTFNDSLWLRAAAKLTENFLSLFSDEFCRYPSNLEDVLYKLYVEACESLTESTSSLNVVIHKDLWVNNIMFKYEGKTPVNSLLIDFQCVRYGPPAFDLMIFLYFNTSRSLRKEHETAIFKHYYVKFLENIDDDTTRRLQILGFDFDDFVGWCHRARMFGMLETIGIFPYVLMEPSVAKKAFDDPETYMKSINEDRTKPVVAHARECAGYRQRQLEVCEEFVERYVLKRLVQ